MYVNLGFAAFLVIVAGALLLRSRYSWQVAQRKDLESQEFDFLRRQYRRRMQANVMIGLVGVAIAVGTIVPAGLIQLVYWFGVLLLVLWIVFLAAADMLVTHTYFNQLRNEQISERARLHAELLRMKQQAEAAKRAEEHRGNGRERPE